MCLAQERGKVGNMGHFEGKSNLRVGARYVMLDQEVTMAGQAFHTARWPNPGL